MILNPPHVSITKGPFWDRRIHAVLPVATCQGLFTLCGKKTRYPRSNETDASIVSCHQCQRVLKFVQWVMSCSDIHMEERLSPVLKRLEYAINLSKKGAENG